MNTYKKLYAQTVSEIIESSQQYSLLPEIVIGEYQQDADTNATMSGGNNIIISGTRKGKISIVVGEQGSTQQSLRPHLKRANSGHNRLYVVRERLVVVIKSNNRR